MTHDGCVADGLDRALPAGIVRGWRLILSALHEDEDAVRNVLDEVGDCPDCLRAIVVFLANTTARSYSDRAGERRAIEIVEDLIMQAIDKIDEG